LPESIGLGLCLEKKIQLVLQLVKNNCAAGEHALVFIKNL